jgi:lysophospholipase L1-like esterase
MVCRGALSASALRASSPKTRGSSVASVLSPVQGGQRRGRDSDVWLKLSIATRCWLGVAVLALIGYGQVYAQAGADCLKPPEHRAVVRNASSAHWDARMARFGAETTTSPVPRSVWLGDSHTERFDLAQYFPGVVAINRGIGGDKVGGGRYLGITDRRDDIVALKPDVLVVMIGINDIVFAATPLEGMERCFRAWLNDIRMRLPKTRLVIVSVPKAPRFADRDRAVEAWNQFLLAQAMATGARWVDLAGALANSPLAKIYDADGLHLGRDGYRVWAGLMADVVRTRRSQEGL